MAGGSPRLGPIARRDRPPNPSRQGRSKLIDRLSREGARFLDAADPLAPFRERFYVPSNRIYLDGNSLGLASIDAETEILKALATWKAEGIGGWTSGERPWFGLGEELGDLQAPLVGARPGEVVVTGSTTANLHALVSTFYRPEGTRTCILADALDFPSDLYALESQIRLKGRDPTFNLRLVPSRDGRTIDEADVISAMDETVALIVLPSVLYRSGQLLDIGRLARAARKRGIPIGFDCSHSAGSVPHQLHDWDVDFALWCNYKYLNGGPGAIASLFVHERNHAARPSLVGWWGYRKDRQFDMSRSFEGAANAGAWQIGTPPILGLAGLRGSLAMFQEAGLERVREKSLAQTDFLIELLDRQLTDAPYSFSLGTPRSPNRRGGHVAIEHADALRIVKSLRVRGVIPDFRPPNVIRLAPIALYTSYAELWETGQILRAIIDRGEHLALDRERDLVS